MREFFQSFDNREIAMIVWLLGLFLWAASKPDVRHSMPDLIRAALAKQIVIGVVIFALYFACLVWGLAYAGVWVESQLKLTLFWFFSAGLVGLGSVAKVSDGDARILDKVKNNFSFSVFLDFFINLHRMPLFVEFLFVPFTALLGAIVAYSSYHERYKKIEIIGNRLIIGIGLLVMAYALFEMAINFDKVATVDNARALLLPIAFSLGMLPIFLVGVIYVSYENVFIRLPYLIKDESLHGYAKWVLVRSFRTDTRSLHTWFRQAWNEHLNSVESIDASIAKLRV